MTGTKRTGPRRNPFLTAARKAINSGAGYSDLRDDMAGHPGQYPGAGFIDSVYETGYRRGAEVKALRVLTRLATATERAEARRLLSALEDAEAAVAEYKAPELTVSLGDGEVALRCPWCGTDVDPHSALIVVDSATRHNRGSHDPHMQDQLVNVADGPTDFHTSYLASGCCGLPVRLPADWDINWH